MSTVTTTAGNTQTIAVNSFWLALEVVIGVASAFVVSVLVARIVGPERLANFAFMVFVTSTTATAGAFGLPITTRKFMAEYLNLGEHGVAKAVYIAALRVQVGIALGLTVVGAALVSYFEAPDDRLIAYVLVLNLVPQMAGFIPSQAHLAAEAVRKNTIAASVGVLVNLALTLASLFIGWGLIGIAAAMLLGTCLETGLKLRSAHRMLARVDPAPIPGELRRRMFVYSQQGLAIMLLHVLVWSRSDVLFLKILASDPRQLSFFSYAFNLCERLLVLPISFANSVGVSLLAQYGRGRDRTGVLAVEGARYAFLLALPLLAGVAAVSGPAVMLLYGEQWRAMGPVLAVVALLAIPKALAMPVTQLLQATDNQGFLIKWGCACAFINVVLDVLLIPRSGALGAAVANGIAQAAAAGGVWWFATRAFRLDLRVHLFGRIALCGLGMGAVALLVAQAVGGTAGLAAAIMSGAAVWLSLLRLTGSIDNSDRQRFLAVSRSVPRLVRPGWNAVVNLLAPEPI